MGWGNRTKVGAGGSWGGGGGGGGPICVPIAPIDETPLKHCVWPEARSVTIIIATVRWPWRSRLAPRPLLQFPVAYSAPLQ